MEFCKSKVYTALNADELKVGSKVMVANSLATLKNLVEEDLSIVTLVGIDDESYSARFFDGTTNWYLAYLVEEPEENKLRWTDLKVGDIITSGNLTAMITEIDKEYHIHICAGHKWFSDEELEDWEKVEK